MPSVFAGMYPDFSFSFMKYYLNLPQSSFPFRRVRTLPQSSRDQTEAEQERVQDSCGPGRPRDGEEELHEGDRVLRVLQAAPRQATRESEEANLTRDKIVPSETNQIFEKSNATTTTYLPLRRKREMSLCMSCLPDHTTCPCSARTRSMDSSSHLGYTSETVYGVAICPRGNLPYT